MSLAIYCKMENLVLVWVYFHLHVKLIAGVRKCEMSNFIFNLFTLGYICFFYVMPVVLVNFLGGAWWSASACYGAGNHFIVRHLTYA